MKNTQASISRKKIEELKDKESRQFFYEEHIESGLPIQIRELRKKRKLTQKALATLAEVDQSNISDWENPNYAYTPQIGTLKRLANAFDVPLIVRFGSWEEVLSWDSNLTPGKLAPDTFDDSLKGLYATAARAARQNPVRQSTDQPSLFEASTGMAVIELDNVDIFDSPSLGLPSRDLPSLPSAKGSYLSTAIQLYRPFIN